MDAIFCCRAVISFFGAAAHGVSLLICSVEKFFKLMPLKLVLFYRNLQLTPYQCLFACTTFCSKIAIEVFALKAHLKYAPYENILFSYDIDWVEHDSH